MAVKWKILIPSCVVFLVTLALAAVTFVIPGEDTPSPARWIRSCPSTTAAMSVFYALLGLSTILGSISACVGGVAGTRVLPLVSLSILVVVLVGELSLSIAWTATGGGVVDDVFSVCWWAGGDFPWVVSSDLGCGYGDYGDGDGPNGNYGDNGNYGRGGYDNGYDGGDDDEPRYGGCPDAVRSFLSGHLGVCGAVIAVVLVPQIWLALSLALGFVLRPRGVSSTGAAAALARNHLVVNASTPLLGTTTATTGSRSAPVAFGAPAGTEPAVSSSLTSSLQGRVLDRAEVERFSEESGGGQGDRSDCAICFEPFFDLEGTITGSGVSITRCRHMFHLDCLRKWSGMGKTTCPLCRESFLQR